MGVRVLEAVNCDEWAKTDPGRAQAIHRLAEAIRAGAGGHRVALPTTGLFEAISKHMSGH